MGNQPVLATSSTFTTTDDPDYYDDQQHRQPTTFLATTVDDEDNTTAQQVPVQTDDSTKEIDPELSYSSPPSSSSPSCQQNGQEQQDTASSGAIPATAANKFPSSVRTEDNTDNTDDDNDDEDEDTENKVVSSSSTPPGQQDTKGAEPEDCPQPTHDTDSMETAVLPNNNHSEDKHNGDENKNKSALQQAKDKITQLVLLSHQQWNCDGIDVSMLPQLYKETYGRTLKAKTLGFTKLKPLIETIPNLQLFLKNRNGKPPALFIKYTATTTTKASCSNNDGDTNEIPNPKQVKNNNKKQTMIHTFNKDVQEKKSGNSMNWLEPAVEHWVNRALKRCEKVNQGRRTSAGESLPLEYFEHNLVGEVKNSKKLRPNGHPDEKTYTRHVIKALRKDPRLRWEKDAKKGFLYWSSSETRPEEEAALLVVQKQPVQVQSSADESTRTAIQIQSNIKNTATTGLHECDGNDLSELEEETDEHTSMPEAFLSFYQHATSKQHSGDQQAETMGANAEVENTPSSDSRINVSAFVSKEKGTATAIQQRAFLGDASTVSSFEESALLGCLSSEEQQGGHVFLNTHEPFCLATVGVQGAGKSHTLACILESCLLSADDVIRLQKPMTALVLHYDLNTSSVCEAAGLLSPSSVIPNCPSVPQSRAVILVSPTFYKQRKAFYGSYCTVRPLLFKWSSLTADHIKRIMRIGPSDNQLYVASFMTLLRRYQRQGIVPKFTDFIRQVKDVCDIKGQQGPLEQRIALLEFVVAESEANADIREESMDLAETLSSDLDLIITDLTDPLLSKEEVNGLFQVITEQFRTSPTKGGKVLALDEAHKFMEGVESDGLSEAIVDAARLMRHDGMRLIVSTQSPKALAPELLELVSVAVLHQFHSRDWWAYLRQKLPIPDSSFECILSLLPGDAVVFASRSALSEHVVKLGVRPRLTADFGSSRRNK